MGKLFKIMSQADSQALRNRAESINTQASIAQTSLINTLKVKKSEIELRIQDLTDFAPDNKESLRPGVSNWQPSEWVKQLQKAKTELYEVNISLKIAESTFEEFFEDDEEAAAAE